MRIERILLRDFRGVESLDVEFDPHGVTIVEGPNEIGKTSMVDAFDLLLDCKDTARKRAVQKAQPVGRDVGPFVEAQLTVGRYRLVYRKRWLRERMTELEILAPAAEQLVGEDAHRRVLEILGSETDHALFNALRYQQGVGISQAAVAESPSLVAALDAAAGGNPGGASSGGSDALFERINEERLRYFTEGGAELRSRKDALAAVKSLETDVADTERDIGELDAAAERQARFEGEVAKLKKQQPEVAQRIADGSKAVEAIEEIERRALEAQHATELAESGLREAVVNRDTRTSLVDETEQAAGALTKLRKELASSAPDLEAAMGSVSQAEEALSQKRDSVGSAEQEATGRREFVELLELQLRRDQLKERHERVEAADRELEEIEQFLADCAVDEGKTRQIEQAADDLAVANGRAQGGLARLSLEAACVVEIEMQGERRQVEAGARAEQAVSSELTATIGDIATLVVSPSEDASEIEQKRARAEDRLNELLRAAGVDSADGAHELLRERSLRESARESVRRSRSEALRDLEPAELAAKLERADQRLSASGGEGAAAATEAGSFEQARESARQAEEKLSEARSLESEAAAGLKGSEEALRVVEDKGLTQRTRLEVAEKDAARLGVELSDLRSRVADNALGEKVVEAEEQLRAARALGEQCETELDALDPETLRATLRNDRDRLEGLSDAINTNNVLIAGTRATLEHGGQEGLADRLAEVRAKLETDRRKVDAENRRASAALRLYELLGENRDRARQAYIGPFTDKVNGYGRVIFGPSTKIEIDHLHFSITSRTLDGTVVPFEFLSGGAQEQLAVLSRLACGALASSAGERESPGGVPVIIDDALGYSDPGRLERLGAVFGVAGRDCQVIVLSCEPDRYRGVGGAKFVSLG